MQIRKSFSLIACLLICVIYISVRTIYSDFGRRPDLKVTTWDALGYYMYLPATFIYKDVKKLEWFPAVDAQYHVSGGELYQALKQENGNYYFKYLGGVAVMQAPFFFLAHLYASQASHYQADGFSPPYQYAVAFGNIFYFIISLFLLRGFLSRHFTDRVVTLSLLLLTLATNLIQYIAVDGGMSHGYIFPLYVFILWATYQWHKRPSWGWAAVIGYIIGLATISRPTEAVMLFIPLLWNTHTKEEARKKWRLVGAHRAHLFVTILFGLIGILPQLIYWKTSTGSWVFDVGSKWTFLNPFFRVLVGWEKGWFIYTPVTIFFIAGLFFVKRYPFKNSVIWFCILNIYIVISWFDWRYGGSYSTRALTQSYPVFSLSLAAFLTTLHKPAWKLVAASAGLYFIIVNLFQLYQYNEVILHYNDMNRKYYGRIYLNPQPDPVDMSLLDTDEFLYDEEKYRANRAIKLDGLAFSMTAGGNQPILDTSLTLEKGTWVKVDVAMFVEKGLWNSKLVAEIDGKERVFRLDNPLTKENRLNHYCFYERIDTAYGEKVPVRLSLRAGSDFTGTVQQLTLTVFK